MIQNKFGEPVYSQQDLIHAMMLGHDLFDTYADFVTSAVDCDVIKKALQSLELPELALRANDESASLEQFDCQRQNLWFMPQSYKDLDIAEHVLGLCSTPAELQRVGEELLLYQERNLFDLLRYLKFLVDTMQQHGVIWGVGRGSSVASYVLYLLGVHRVNSMFYELDPREFLR